MNKEPIKIDMTPLEKLSALGHEHQPYHYVVSNDDDRFAQQLIGPDNFCCYLGEIEDCNWSRSGKAAVERLNEQHEAIAKLESENRELKEQNSGLRGRGFALRQAERRTGMTHDS